MAAKKSSAKKRTSKKTGISVRGTNAPVVSWKDALAKRAQEGRVAKEKPSTGDYISIKGNKFSLNKEILGREIDCVIVDWNFENSYFSKDYKEGESTAPDCFAIGYDEDEMAPHEDSPNKQCDNCQDCWAFEWGSGKGDGKACASRRRLALVVEGKDGNPEMKVLRLAPTSLKNWKKFIDSIEFAGLQPIQCAVKIHFDEESTAQAHPLVFELLNEITDEKQLDFLAGTMEQATKMLDKPYDVSNFGKVKPGKKGKAPTKKKAVAKRRSKLS